jgi:hypothetical protein
VEGSEASQQILYSRQDTQAISCVGNGRWVRDDRFCYPEFVVFRPLFDSLWSLLCGLKPSILVTGDVVAGGQRHKR